MLAFVKEIDPDKSLHMVDFRKAFMWKDCKCGRRCQHVCLVFEKLACNMLDIMRHAYKGYLINNHRYETQQAEQGRGSLDGEMEEDSLLRPRPASTAERLWAARGFTISFVRDVTQQVSPLTCDHSQQLPGMARGQLSSCSASESHKVE